MFSFCCLYLCMAYLWQSKTSRKCFAHLIPWDGGGGQMNSLLAWWQASFNLLSYLTSLRTIIFKRQSRSCNSLLKNIPSVSWYSQNKQQNPKPTRDPRPSKTSSYLLLALSPHWVISTLIYHKLFVPAHVRVTATLFSLLRRLLFSCLLSVLPSRDTSLTFEYQLLHCVKCLCACLSGHQVQPKEDQIFAYSPSKGWDLLNFSGS